MNPFYANGDLFAGEEFVGIVPDHEPMDQDFGIHRFPLAP
jgi:hypothetical protein